MMNSINTGWSLVGTTKNKNGRRGGRIGYIKGMATLVGGVVVGVIVLLAGCPASTSSGSSGGRTIGEAIDCTMDADTECSFAIGDTFEGGKGTADDDSDWIEILLANNATYRISVDATADAAGDSATATLTMYSTTATQASPATIGSDMLWTATMAQNYYIGVVLNVVGTYTLSVDAAADADGGVCNRLDQEGDCDGDSVINSTDNCPLVANMNQLNTDNRDNNIATGGDALGDVCDVDDDDDGVNDVDSAGNALDRFVLNACASRDSDDDMLPDEIIDPTAADAGRCSEDEAILLINLLAGLSHADIPSCAAVTTYMSDARVNCADTDDDGDGAADASDVDLDNDGLIEINTLEALNNIRHNLAGTTYDDEANDDTGNLGSTSGAPTTEQPACDDGDSNTTLLLCGYELTRNLDFAVAASYAGNTVSDDWCPGPKTGDTPCVPASPDAATMSGFMPITDADSNSFTAILDGNLFTINNLYIHSAASNSGLLQGINGGAIRRLGLTNISVSGTSTVGGLASSMNGAIITAVGVSGAVTGSSNVGGLAGNANDGTISGSWSTVAVTSDSDNIGGLLGFTTGNNVNISLSYVRGSVTSTGGQNKGGLIGNNFGDITIRSSWVSVEVSGGTNRGAIIGIRNSTTNSVTLSDFYRSTGTTFPSKDIGLLSGSITGAATGLTTDQMQAVGGANFGGSSVADRFGTGCGGAWVFSDATTTHFPKLREIISGADTPADCTDDTYGDELPGQN